MKKPLFALAAVATLALLGGTTSPVPVLHAQRPATPRPSQQPADSWLLRPQQVFDATSEQAQPGWVVLVTGNRIVAAGPPAGIKAPADARTIDLPGMTLLPGLIEAHTHIFLLEVIQEFLANGAAVHHSSSKPPISCKASQISSQEYPLCRR